MSVIFIFVDGIGIGNENNHNPFYLKKYEAFEELSGGVLSNKRDQIHQERRVFNYLDANLEVEGLPQSGTGQTALFTGQNAAQFIGKHFGPFPHSKIKPFLKEESILKDLVKAGKRAQFMNAYPPIFFEHSEKRNRWSCTTLMARSAGLKLNTTQDIKDGKAITAEIVQNAWREKLNIDIPKINEKDAANRMITMSKENDFLLYEYYLTDKAGHNQSKEDAEVVLSRLNLFLVEIMKQMSSNDLLILSSDHGNLEDLNTKTHTRNPVPLFAYGENAIKFKGASSLVDVKEKILNVLQKKEN